MKSFSERKGIVPVTSVIQISAMNDNLRNSLWNVLDDILWSSRNFIHADFGGTPYMDSFSHALWSNYFKKPTDARPVHSVDRLAMIRKAFFGYKWNEVYDFIEYMVSYFKNVSRLPEQLNLVLERESAGYRIISGLVVDITSKDEIKMLEEALKDNRFGGVSSHLLRALELLTDREHPDYRNSIKESVSAIESMARIVTENSKATLPDALKTLEKKGTLHPALKEGFLKLYGYTSDQGGIRHAMLDEPNISSADARFFLLSCTSFSQYLKAQLA